MTLQAAGEKRGASVASLCGAGCCQHCACHCGSKRRRIPAFFQAAVPRKERGLLRLARDFLLTAPTLEAGHILQVADMEARLQVPRRRIYDVFNTMQGLNMMQKGPGKGTMQWTAAAEGLESRMQASLVREDMVALQEELEDMEEWIDVVTRQNARLLQGARGHASLPAQDAWQAVDACRQTLGIAVSYPPTVPLALETRLHSVQAPPGADSDERMGNADAGGRQHEGASGARPFPQRMERPGSVALVLPAGRDNHHPMRNAHAVGGLSVQLLQQHIEGDGHARTPSPHAASLVGEATCASEDGPCLACDTRDGEGGAVVETADVPVIMLEEEEEHQGEEEGEGGEEGEACLAFPWLAGEGVHAASWLASPDSWATYPGSPGTTEEDQGEEAVWRVYPSHPCLSPTAVFPPCHGAFPPRELSEDEHARA